MLLALVLALSPFGHDHYITQDGAWCWFADPRAVWVDGRILAGSVAGDGSIRTHLYDPKTKTRQESVLAAKFERDDHDNPAFLRLPGGGAVAFWSKHSGPDLFMSTSIDLTTWTNPVKINPNDPAYKGPAGALNAYTYPNPQMLRDERNRIYLFWRGMNWKPTISTSDDLGKTWSKGRILISLSGDPAANRPYMKVAGDGKGTIHFAFTDGHPRNEPTNSIYYLRYRGGSMRGADDRAVASMKQLPVRPDQADVVFDGRAEGIRAWIWDIAHDSSGRPIITYSRLPKEDTHEYRYAWWNGRRWVDRKIVAGGKWFPQTAANTTEREPHYSGGVVLDPNDPRFVYLSRPIGERFEVERWFTSDGGETWSHVALTGSSKHDSVRPFVVRGARPDGGPIALFMNVNRYVHYTDYQGTIQAANEDRGPFPATQAMRAADAVWRWVRSNPSRYTKTEWMLAPLYSGVLDYADARGDDQPRERLRLIGTEIGWKMGPRPGMADDVAVGQSFIQLYERDRNPAQLAPVKAWIDGWLAKSHNRSLEWKDGIHNEEMAWCDALFMAPPVIAMLGRVTGEASYFKRLGDLWWKTSDYLYDPTEQLYFRDSRYFTPREANGKKVFWSRGNGWVLAGLARVLQNLPADDSGRPRFEKQFREMATRIASLQTGDGTWHASLLDPASYPQRETSGTGFFVYAMAWGVNAGLLDRKTFEPAIRRGYAALCESVDPNGRLMWVQPIGQDPRTVKASDTDAYGVGAFLMASVQVEKMGR
ncbi:MAG: glycoside hydrolase family 88 protein [Methanoregulaceae archaeon]|nr:glycoside hydrolase family 88 protein [Methanoregulaceae archaeon]